MKSTYDTICLAIIYLIDSSQVREIQYYSARDPYYCQNTEPVAPPPQTPDISALLRALNGQQQQQQQPLPEQPTTSQPSTSGLEAIFARFANSNPQTAPMQVPQPIQQLPSVPPFNLQAMLGAMQQNNQSPQTYPIPPPPGQITDLSAILAQFGQQQPAAQSQSYNYGNTYQGDTRKRQSDYEDQRDGKRQKPTSEKKVRRQTLFVSKPLTDVYSLSTVCPVCHASFFKRVHVARVTSVLSYMNSGSSFLLQTFLISRFRLGLRRWRAMHRRESVQC